MVARDDKKYNLNERLRLNSLKLKGSNKCFIHLLFIIFKQSK